jgi:hypothetical protein
MNQSMQSASSLKILRLIAGWQLIILLSIAATGLDRTQADPPRDPQFQEYSVILEKNPFSKFASSEVKTAEVIVPTAPPVDKYVLKGVSRMPEGLFVVMANIRAPQEDLMIYQGKENSQGIEIIEVKQNKLDYTKTEVTIKDKDNLQVVTYSPEILTQTPLAQTDAPVSGGLDEGIEKKPDRQENMKNAPKKPNEQKPDTGRKIPTIRRKDEK